ncbi:trigger factor [Amycolatopsis regifaucium]|uniref:Trigger factor n=1 Tax=Amycolatopsis regifaucium TaxID=546365 RepID=A0A154MGL0_9PSEU|nr:trigger factor [Amycolatopsis regifaucium]KZB83565.1 trigger factor [Amycolatopsis regifaucium]OKA03335.1 trigger factor [Amycolatopsis regifaucium]SFJ61960.1 trigger factor [Amycolatopsis regifaucium]
MKSTVEQLSPTRVKINVEVPFDELKPNFDRAYRKIAQQVRIPGFRPGKAPARVLESRIGRAPVLDEVVNEVIPAKYMEAVRAGEVRTLGQPEFEVTKLEDREVLEFTAEVDVRPEISLPDLEGFSVSVDDVELTDAEVDEQLDELRARFGTLTGVERAAENGDFVSIDLAATVDGQEVEEASTTGLSYEIGSGQLVDGIDEAIIGANAGETKTFTTKLVAGEHAGKDAEVTVTVQTIKQRELPEADDEFAQMASEFDTIDELKADLRERLGRVKKMQQGVQARDKVLEELLERTEVAIPEKVLEAEIENRKHDAIHPFDHDEAQFAQALEAEGRTLEEFDTEVRQESEKAVRTQLLLDSIADAEQTSVNDGELTERIIYQAQRFGVSPDEYVQRAQQSGQLTAIYADVRRGKALASVVRKTTVTDASGAEVDLEELFGPAEEETQVTDETAKTAAE